ncbi:MAG TPA: twin-arginine translocase TatA/TatE family subunit [Pyrinomonadaceae bacterium]|nr:twin-arginine translocase TatA/TatE family subunit [Pyrinomonadaceae bacterium]
MKLLLFVIGTEWIIVLVVVAILLLFGGTKLPQLAKALGQSKKAFKEGIDEGDRETDPRSKLNSVEDEALFDEARRRAQQMRSEDARKIDR